MTEKSTKSKKPEFHAYQVRDLDGGKAHWTRIGAAWGNRDGGFTIVLECLPVNGRIVCRKPKSEDVT